MANACLHPEFRSIPRMKIHLHNAEWASSQRVDQPSASELIRAVGWAVLAEHDHALREGRQGAALNLTLDTEGLDRIQLMDVLQVIGDYALLKLHGEDPDALAMPLTQAAEALRQRLFKDAQLE